MHGDLSFHRFLVKCQVVSLLRVALANEHHVTDCAESMYDVRRAGPPATAHATSYFRSERSSGGMMDRHRDFSGCRARKRREIRRVSRSSVYIDQWIARIPTAGCSGTWIRPIQVDEIQKVCIQGTVFNGIPTCLAKVMIEEYRSVTSWKRLPQLIRRSFRQTPRRFHGD